jgi:hypothetical protein
MISLEELGYAVQCRRVENGVTTMAHYWETIAAFNSESVAQRYAKDCADNGPSFEYRVIETETRSQWLEKINDAYDDGVRRGQEAFNI